jgi:NADPH:quinone reductase-like Zn-dependent oxidoreductase
MKAAFHSTQGGSDVQPAPSPGPREVLIRVRATSLDRVDIYTRRARTASACPAATSAGET